MFKVTPARSHLFGAIERGWDVVTRADASLGVSSTGTSSGEAVTGEVLRLFDHVGRVDTDTVVRVLSTATAALVQISLLELAADRAPDNQVSDQEQEGDN